jgi:hypothetical protein
MPLVFSLESMESVSMQSARHSGKAQRRTNDYAIPDLCEYRSMLFIAQSDINQRQLDSNNQKHDDVQLTQLLQHRFTPLLTELLQSCYSSILKMAMQAEPSMTTSNAGKIKNASGNISFMVVLAAASSASCLLFVRRESA